MSDNVVAAVIKSVEAEKKRGRGRPKKASAKDARPQTVEEGLERAIDSLGGHPETIKAEIFDRSILGGFNEKRGLPDVKKPREPPKPTPLQRPAQGAEASHHLPRPEIKDPKSKEGVKKEADWRRRMKLRKGIRIALDEFPHLKQLGFALPDVQAPLDVYVRRMEEIKMEISTVNEPEWIRASVTTVAGVIEDNAEEYTGFNLKAPYSLKEIVRRTVYEDPDGRSAVAEIALDYAGVFDGSPLMRLGYAFAKQIYAVAEANKRAELQGRMAPSPRDAELREQFRRQRPAAPPDPRVMDPPNEIMDV